MTETTPANAPAAATSPRHEPRVVTEAALLARIPALLDEPLRTLGRRAPLTVAPGATLAECLRAIQRGGVGDSVVVADRSGRLLGVLTERDIFASLIGTSIDLRRPVDEFMNREPHTLRLGDTVRDAMALMQTGRYRNVPIVDDGVVVGIVRQQDILRALAESFPEELLNLPPRPHQQLEETEGA